MAKQKPNQNPVKRKQQRKTVKASCSAFCGQFKGELALDLIRTLEGDAMNAVYSSIGERGLYSPERWKELRKEGWRVVKVKVQVI